MKFFQKKKRKLTKEEGHIIDLIRQQTAGYMTQEDVDKHIRDIQKDEKRRRIWNGLTAHQKIRVLRAAAARKREQNGKK